MVRVRFAPSPTGQLHIGGARTAIFNYLLARQSGGAFVLRIDDTDRERSTSENEQDIKSSLSWLGIDWDEGPDEAGGEFGPYRQSELLEKHKAAAKQLLDCDRAYLDPEGVVRLRYPQGDIVVEDMVCGRCVFSTEALGPEPVIVRSDGTPTYHLASVVDDINMKITHVVRGQDHLTNTAKHQVLFQALDSPVPCFAHLPLILGDDGSKLSKRNTESLTTVAEFRQNGYLPEALINYLVLLGWSHPEGEEVLALAEIIRNFTISRVNQTAAKFEPGKLDFLNGWWLRNLPAERIAKDALSFTGEYRGLIENRGQGYWLEAITGLRGMLGRLTDAEKLAELLFTLSVELKSDALERFGQGENRRVFDEVASIWREILSATPLELDRDCYTVAQFKEMTKRLAKQVSAGKKDVFQAVRVLVTGSTSGPDLHSLASVVSRDILLSRAEGVIDSFRGLGN